MFDVTGSRERETALAGSGTLPQDYLTNCAIERMSNGRDVKECVPESKNQAKLDYHDEGNLFSQRVLQKPSQHEPDPRKAAALFYVGCTPLQRLGSIAATGQ